MSNSEGYITYLSRRVVDFLWTMVYNMFVEYKVVQTEEFRNWRANLKDLRAQTKIRLRIERASIGNFGDWKTESGEVKAMRLHYGPGYRLYYVVRSGKIIFLLCGGGKSTQAADIKKAIALAKDV